MGFEDRDADQAGEHRLVRRVGRRKRAPLQRARCSGHLPQAERKAASWKLPCAVAPHGRGAHGRPHLHLQHQERRCRPDQQLGGTVRDARYARQALRRLHARTHDVCRAVLDGPHWLAYRPGWRRGFRLRVCGRQHAHDDPHGARRDRPHRCGRCLRALRAFSGRAAGGQREGCALAVQRQGEVDRPFPRDARDLVVWLRLRRQRAARQEVPGAAHRLGHGARRRLARRAHADPRR